MLNARFLLHSDGRAELTCHAPGATKMCSQRRLLVYPLQPNLCRQKSYPLILLYPLSTHYGKS